MQENLQKAGFPPELLSKPNWCCWRYWERNGNRTKRPCMPDGKDAKSNDPATWRTLEAVSQAADMDGVGFFFDGTCFGVDLDHVIDEKTGEIDAQALEIVEKLNSYAEYSPSGTGLHILCLGSFDGKGRRKGAVEVYGQGRFFTVTGRTFGEAKPIRDASAEVVQIIEQYIDGGKKQTTKSAGCPQREVARPALLSGQALIQRIRRSKNGAAFEALYDRGDTSTYSGDDSAADMALCNILAFWTKKDAVLMDELFRSSALFRAKWDERHGADTYGALTIAKAIEDTPHVLGELVAAKPESPFYRFEQAYQGIDGYQVSQGRTYSVRIDENGEEQRMPLAGFIALPVEAISRDDGAEVRQEFVIEGVNADYQTLPCVTVPAGKLAAMSWPLEAWGFAANIMPGQSIKDKLRYAIAEAGNRTAKHRTIYTHTGWRRSPAGGWMYLYQGGAVGCEGVSVELEGALASYALPDQAGSMLPSLALLDVLPRRVAIPLLGHVFLAPLVEFLQQAGCPPLFTLFLAGSSGAKKSTAAALALAHYGAEFSASHMPANFHDTAATVQRKAFSVKDAPLLVDDLHPVADHRERSRMDGIAQTLARAWGDRAERGRMRADLTLQTAQPPRGLGIMTGESLPDVGESGVARFFLVDVHRGEVEITQQLTDAQRKAAQGELAASMRSYLEWLRPQGEVLPEALRGLFEEYRAIARNRLTGAHDRQPPAVAWMLLGFDMMLSAMIARGEQTEEQAQGLWNEALQTLVSLARDQQADMRQESPAELFLSTLAELEAAGAVYVHDLDALPSTISADVPMIGYRDKHFTYLIPTMAFGEVCRALQRAGRCFPISRGQLWKHLAERSLIEVHTGGALTKAKRFGTDAPRVIWLKQKNDEQMTMPL